MRDEELATHPLCGDLKGILCHYCKVSCQHISVLFMGLYFFRIYAWSKTVLCIITNSPDEDIRNIQEARHYTFTTSNFKNSFTTTSTNQ